MNVLVIGRSGQLATELLRVRWPDGTKVTALGRPELDLTDGAALAQTLAAHAPDVVVNAAAYTAVDRAESEPDAAFAVNGVGVHHLAVAARALWLPVIHVSTDHVFDGSGTRPWREQDAPRPLGVYGRSKLEGERALRAAAPPHVILRTSWLFAAHGRNFVRTMLRLGAERTALSVVADQIGCPTPAADLAAVVAALAPALAKGGVPTGVYHYAGAGPVSWYDFATAIFAAAGHLIARVPELRAISTEAYGAPAPRPRYSVLDCTKIERILGIKPLPWAAGIDAVIREIRESSRVPV